MCTGIRFTSTSGCMYFGRNLDWTQGYGERVVVTPPAAEVPAAFERPGDLDSAHAHAVIGMGIVAIWDYHRSPALDALLTIKRLI